MSASITTTYLTVLITSLVLCELASTWGMYTLTILLCIPALVCVVQNTGSFIVLSTALILSITPVTLLLLTEHTALVSSITSTAYTTIRNLVLTEAWKWWYSDRAVVVYMPVPEGAVVDRVVWVVGGDERDGEEEEEEEEWWREGEREGRGRWGVF
ncbi:hypothetical protein EX30DRAFT_349744 [Ascodesmis nigricans]|uniref:Uncharacterized protein n=1 Tax=Ascodesmis nigricans TaxID=341454 RepID=A0A4S2MU53_9PEZI|nr:hypothetical protein EX30DRAFT_349744 [Ascodesmis nigricans]